MERGLFRIEIPTSNMYESTFSCPCYREPWKAFDGSNEHILSDSTGSCLGTFLEHADITPALMASFASVLSQIVSKGLAIGDCSWLVTRLHIPDIVNISPQRSRFKF